jgi:hypothetical protein
MGFPLWHIFYLPFMAFSLNRKLSSCEAAIRYFPNFLIINASVSLYLKMVMSRLFLLGRIGLMKFMAKVHKIRIAPNSSSKARLDSRKTGCQAFEKVTSVMEGCDNIRNSELKGVTICWF